MATRVYRPDASRSWRESGALSSNEVVSDILARQATDAKNRALKARIRKTENLMTLKTQRVEAFGERYERAAAGVGSYAGSLQGLVGDIGQRGAQVQQISAYINELTAELERKQKMGLLTQADIYRYKTLRPELMQNYRLQRSVYNAQREDYAAAQAAYERQQQQLQALYGQYQRSTRVAKKSVKTYKRAVRAYNAGYYPV